MERARHFGGYPRRAVEYFSYFDVYRGLAPAIYTNFLALPPFWPRLRYLICYSLFTRSKFDCQDLKNIAYFSVTFLATFSVSLQYCFLLIFSFLFSAFYRLCILAMSGLDPKGIKEKVRLFKHIYLRCYNLLCLQSRVLALELCLIVAFSYIVSLALFLLFFFFFSIVFFFYRFFLFLLSIPSSSCRSKLFAPHGLFLWEPPVPWLLLPMAWAGLALNLTIIPPRSVPRSVLHNSTFHIVIAQEPLL